MRDNCQLREHYPLHILSVNVYVLVKGTFVHEFAIIYTLDFIPGTMRITQSTEAIIIFH